ncbi:hypothetical protein DY000_02040628 [Brassica cretica]|uniref:Uncharacterized protein n=1 Tax=Brassica cretica TaxID=69181 RepID=A0ABQ7BPJ2_BRACR|nr:hypothetical protein DY000_02040628 [Brassica cretica]
MYEEVDKLSSETRSRSSLSSESPVYENAAMVAGKSASRQTWTACPHSSSWLGLPAFQLVARLARIPARGSITFSTESFDNG